ncbi:MAG: cytochrome c [Gammaproteobacteria bacterium]|nr:cytochrome c [Gammaproteobacteria bacterium]MBU1723955.1 cytochrome c [Gammaproteobacteria bacterium]MBU2007148.1 cytochrome c [Gammaproteobacteria bacterium]
MKSLLTVTTVLLCMALPAKAETGAVADIPLSRQAEIRYLLKQDCGSCHGMQLTGGLGPALTAERLKPLPESLLTATILKGRAGTPMPPWETFLSEVEATWLAQQLRAGTALQEETP